MTTTTPVIASTILNFKEEEITSIVVEGVPYFVGNDVAKVLGYTDYRGAVTKRVDERDKTKSKINYKGQNRAVTLINEIGVFDLIMGSHLEGVREFKVWLVREVLPSITKYGMYLTPEARELRESNPEQFEGNYQEMAKELEEKEKLMNAFKGESDNLRKEVQNLLSSVQNLQTDLSESKKENMELRDDNLNKMCEISELSKNVQKKTEELDSAMTVCEVATLPIHYAIGMSSLMDDMYVSEFSEMTRGKSLDIGRNTLYQIMREVGMLEKQGAYNVASDYGKKNGLVYDEELTIHREYVPFETYKKPKITQKGIALVMQEVAKRLNVQPENVFK